MQKLLKNSLLVLFLIVIFGCQNTSGFKIKALEGDLYIIEVDTSRVIHECYFMNASHENYWRHQYFLYILDSNNDVIPLMYPTNQDIDSCKAHAKKVEAIYKKASKVKFCARDKLEKFDTMDVISTDHDFGPLGKHISPYHALTFDAICNSKNCYSISDTWTYTCPHFKKE